MSTSKVYSFVAGFVAAIVIIAAWMLWQNLELVGGKYEGSPNGAFRIDVTARLRPQPGGKYTITLEDTKKGSRLRTITIELPRSESTTNPRDSGSSIEWDEGSTYADVSLGSSETIRVWVPATARQ